MNSPPIDFGHLLLITWAEYSYNTAFHSSNRCTPFKAVYGRDPPTLIRYHRGAPAVEEVDQILCDRDDILDCLKMHLLWAQQRMKSFADRKRRDVTFEVGDLVLLKLRPYRQRSLAKRLNEKLSPRFYGPFEVLQRVGQVAYKLQLPDGSAIHPVFHVSQLRPALGMTQSGTALPAQLTADMQLMVSPEAVLGVRVGGSANKQIKEVLIKWRDLPVTDATWESATVVQEQYPNFHLEDKVNLGEGSIDRPPVEFTYKRREKKQGRE